MALAVRLDPRVSHKASAGALSAALHVALLLVILSGSRQDGMRTADESPSMLLLLEAPAADRGDVLEQPLLKPAVPPLASEEEFHSAIARLAPQPADINFPASAGISPSDEPQSEASEPSPTGLRSAATTRAMPEAERAALLRRLERLAEESRGADRTEVTWQQDGQQYSAVLIRDSTDDATALERVTAEVSTSDRGRYLTAVVDLRRLAFSQFTQLVDHWDPNVQLHDDEIVGRFHSNSRLNLLYDSSARPKFLGKVTTTARSFNTEAQVSKRDGEIFRGGKETRVARIELPESPQPFAWAPKDENARVHEFTSDTHIRFYPDGSYTWQARDGSEPAHVGELSDQPVYFVAIGQVELHVRGVVAGRVLIFSPLRIVIDGSLTCANNPRDDPESGDYIGLVSNRYVEVASPGVTGRGDLEIDAAIFARRRFVVTNIDSGRNATLHIYGSLAAGTLTATEPRYATKIEYDRRFEHQRPPGFPSTERYEAIGWEGTWTEAPERTVDDSQ